MSSLTDLPQSADDLVTALRDSGEGEWRDLLPIAERMGYHIPDAAGIMPNMTQRLVGTANPSICFTVDGSGERISEALILP